MSYPIITISREYASGGREIGRKLAERLGIAFYDRDRILEAARESGIAEELLQQQDEHTPQSLLYSLVMGTCTLGLGGRGAMPVSDHIYELQAQKIREIAASEPAVIVGRCADAILADTDHHLSFFLYADRAVRVARAMQLYGVSSAEAANRVDRGDAIRGGYYNYYTARKWGVRENYCMSVSTSALGYDATVDLLEACVRGSGLMCK